MNSKEKTIEGLVDYIVVECDIQCQKCKKIKKEYHIDEYSFAEKLINKGWTFKRDRVLCDECSAQKQKSK